jgi:HEAT repeat protein
VEAIRSLGARNAKSALPSIVAAAGDAEQAVRTEAYKAIGLLGDPAAVPQVIALVGAAKEDADRDAAGKALAAVIRKNDDTATRLAPVIEAANAARPEAKAAFLAVLGQVGGDQALAAVREAVKSADEKTHEAAVRALTNWADDAPLADLLALANGERKENLSILSLRGYVRLAGINRDKRKVDENLKVYGDALAASKRPDEKRQVLGGLGDVKDAKALTAIAPLLDDPALVNEAAAAALKVADKFGDKNKPLAKSTLEKILAVSKNDGHKKQAQDLLKKFGPVDAKDAKQDAPRKTN